MEIGIIDRGRGIRKSLEEKYSFTSEYDALQHAIKPGVTRTSGTDPGRWGNTGYGLYVLSELCRQTGEFLLASGVSALCIRDGKQNQRAESFIGTAVKLRMTKPQRDVAEMISEIITKGEQLAGASNGVARASKSSRMFSSSDIPF